MSVMIDQFKRTIDPYGLGYSSVDLLCLGYPLTQGLSFPWTGGVVLLRRRRLYPDVGEWKYCGFARLTETTIVSTRGFAHEASMAFQYAAAVALGNAFVSEWHEPRRVDFDASANLITPALPMFPVNLSAAPQRLGKFVVRWEYDPYGHGAWPSDYQVFEGPTSASVNYNTPLVDSVTGDAFVRHVGARRSFEFNTAVYADASTHVFAVRARNSAGVAELNTFTTDVGTARAGTTSITSIDGLILRRIGL